MNTAMAVNIFMLRYMLAARQGFSMGHLNLKVAA
jgi:hypothetical protein